MSDHPSSPSDDERLSELAATIGEGALLIQHRCRFNLDQKFWNFQRGDADPGNLAITT